MKSRSVGAWLVAAGLLTLMLHAALPALADGPPSGEGGTAAATPRELRIERSLACPQCTDLPLDVCDRDICTDMRNTVHEKVASGASDEQIRQFFVQRYGSRVLLAPPKSPSNLVAWLTPFATLLAGAGAVTIFVRAARRPLAAGPSGERTGAGSLAYRSRVEQDIREFE